jgi:hypothetical protein
MFAKLSNFCRCEIATSLVHSSPALSLSRLRNQIQTRYLLRNGRRTLLDTIREFGQSGAILLLGIAVGAAWIAAIVSPNTSYDRLKDGAADGHVRTLLKSASDPIAVMLLVAGALAILGGALVAGIMALVSALGFFINRWLLPDAATTRSRDDAGGKTQRVLAVSMTLIFMLVAAIGAILAVFGV